MWFFVGVIMYSIWGTKRHWTAGCLCLEFQPDSWPILTWFRKWGGSTLGHTIIYAPGRSGEPGIVDTHTERHEHIHVHQFETMQLMAALLFGYLTLGGFELMYLAILPSGSPLAYVASMLQALLRGEAPYRENIFEESAYALD